MIRSDTRRIPRRKMRRGRCQPPDGTGPVGAALAGATPAELSQWSCDLGDTIDTFVTVWEVDVQEFFACTVHENPCGHCTNSRTAEFTRSFDCSSDGRPKRVGHSLGLQDGDPCGRGALG